MKYEKSRVSQGTPRRRMRAETHITYVLSHRKDNNNNLINKRYEQIFLFFRSV